MSVSLLITSVIIFIIICNYYRYFVFCIKNYSNIKGNDNIIPYFDKYKIIYKLQQLNLLTPRMYHMIADNTFPKQISGLRKQP